MQTLQEDMQQLADANRQLQQKFSLSESERDKHQAEPERKGRSETEWKRLEAGQKVDLRPCCRQRSKGSSSLVSRPSAGMICWQKAWERG